MDSSSWTYFTGNSLLTDGYKIGNLFLGKDQTASLDIDIGAGNKMTWTKMANRYVGYNSGSDATLNLISGQLMLDWRKLYIAQLAGSKGRINIIGPDTIFTVLRDELIVGNANGGDATFYISDGKYRGRSATRIGMNGTFEVYGSEPDEITVGTSSDGYWEQASGGTLKATIDSGGLSPIDVNYVNGTGFGGITTFEAGSILDVAFENGHVETNFWIVMEAEGGMVDHGLALAAGVDPLWDFGVTANPGDGVDVLWVGYAGAVYTPPPATTSMYVNVPVDLPAWGFLDYDGKSTFTSSDPSGYSVDVANSSQDQIFPVEYQQLSSGFDMTEIGQKLTAEFDVQLSALSGGPYDNDFRFGFFDTTDDVQIIARIDLGAGANRHNFKLGDGISYDSDDFQEGNYGTLCFLYGASKGSVSGSVTGAGLTVGVTSRFTYSIERTGESELTMTDVWTDSTSTSTCTWVLDENTTESGVAEYIPSGGYETLDGFGLQIYEQSSGAAYTLSNFKLTYTASLPEGFGYNISEIAVDALSGDVALTLSDPVVGATYTVLAADTLIPYAATEVGSYVAEEPGTITVPAADLAPYTGDTGFFDVKLPVTIIVEE